MKNTDLDTLKTFLVRANIPHATGTAKITKEPDGSRTIEYVEDDYRMHDNFFGGEPYGGRLVIFCKEQAVFLEVYYGRLHDTERTVDEVCGFLREALRRPGENNPYRGPSEYKRDNLVYTSSVKGDIADHTVKEWIYEDGKEIYSGIVIGGLVDQNAQGTM